MDYDKIIYKQSYIKLIPKAGYMQEKANLYFESRKY